MTAVHDDVFEMAASARIAACRAGWQMDARDRDVWHHNDRTYRLTQVNRKAWVWSEVRDG